MSRIPAHGAVVVTSTISAVLALCLLGGIAAEAAAGTAAASPASSAVATATTTGASSNDTVSTANVATTIVTTANVSTANMSGPNMSSASAASSLTSSLIADAAGAASSASSFDVGQSLGATASIGLAGLAAAGQVSPTLPQTTAATGTPDVTATPVTATPVTVQSTGAAVTGTPREIAQSLASARGWSADQWTCLDQLWQRESKFETTIRNSRSGAYGIPQALPASRMASAGADWRTNPVTQVQWGLSYIGIRYATACNAWTHWKHYGWY